MTIPTLNNFTSSRYFCLSNLTPPRESRWKASMFYLEELDQAKILCDRNSHGNSFSFRIDRPGKNKSNNSTR